MGIRVFCPNGHKLNVKAFQAGKKGICPKCDARFEIPAAPSTDRPQTEELRTKKRRRKKRSRIPAPPKQISGIDLSAAFMGQDLAADPFAEGMGLDAARVDRPESASRTVATASSAPVHMSPPSDPFADAPTARWYVQATPEHRYGPAVSSVIRRWLSEGRISPQSLVWREGWSQWLAAGEVFADAFLAIGSTSSSKPADSLQSGGGTIDSLLAELPAAKESILGVGVPLRKQRSSNRMIATVITLLVILALLLAIVFFWIVMSSDTATSVLLG